ncbi:MAG: bifunctional hydroxymethylpyrimidine kinase/phosphomethylpyrimidine kinase [Thermodesulfobacteriota bacterium]|nr:bifunctional hydroxymethylpyrimidine kinase/phosphomethylpyrimidine kinase [Thermodesulfobacteriota bacterium]
MHIALTIAGSDSSGGAGIQADLKTFQAHGVFGMSAITAVTVQNTQKVYDIQEMAPAIVKGQIVHLFEDTAIHAVKIGMVSSTPLVTAIAEALADAPSLPPVVLDPVMISKSGYCLLKPEARTALVERLFPLAEIVTPNTHEAELLAGFPIKTMDDMKAAAEAMIGLGAARAVIKGGHIEGTEAVDVFYDGKTFETLSRPRIDTRNTHGTGCTFSSALAANRALGRGFFESANRAKDYITRAIAQAPSIGKGSGPLNHMVSA